MRLLSAIGFISCALPLATACGSSSSGEGGKDESGSVGATGSGGASGWVPAMHEPAPQVVDDGGRVLANPKVVAIMYDSDPVAADVDKFLPELAASQYWPLVTSEYGVGPLTVLPSIRISDAIPATGTADAMLELLDQNTNGASAPWGAADTNTIYTFVIPEQTMFDAGGGMDCCEGFAGYHDEVVLEGGVEAPYAIICQCPTGNKDPVGELGETTTSISHELIEAATDPYVEMPPFAWTQSDADHGAFTVITSGELADMCEFNLDQFYAPPDMHYTVQRSWSNKAAMAGDDPCVPHVDPEPYFNSVPVLDDEISIDIFGMPSMTKGVKIPVGQKKTIEVDLFSAGPVDKPWTVSAYDASVLLGTQKHLAFTWDKTTGNNGDKLHLTIECTSADSEGFGAELFVIESTLGSQDNLWFGAVGQ